MRDSPAPPAARAIEPPPAPCCLTTPTDHTQSRVAIDAWEEEGLVYETKLALDLLHDLAAAI